jgi:hypothetical protein
VIGFMVIIQRVPRVFVDTTWTRQLEQHPETESQPSPSEADTPSPTCTSARTADDAHGRGLRIIDALADAWGVDPDTVQGKTVWFELVNDAAQSTCIR